MYLVSNFAFVASEKSGIISIVKDAPLNTKATNVDADLRIETLVQSF